MKLRSLNIYSLLAFAVMLIASPPAVAGVCDLMYSQFVVNAKITKKVDAFLSDDLADEISIRARAKMQSILANPFNPKFESELLDKYLEARLEGFHPSYKKLIDDALAAMKVKKGPYIYGAADPQSRQIKLHLPSALKGSISEAYIVAHEVEHLLQFTSREIFGNGFIGLTSTSYIFPSFAKNKFNLEKGAIRAEASFLLSLPKPILKTELDKLSAAVPRNKNSEFLYTALENALKNEKGVAEYIQDTWDGGRYSYSSLLKHQAINWAIFPGSVAPIVWGDFYLQDYYREPYDPYENSRLGLPQPRFGN